MHLGGQGAEGVALPHEDTVRAFGDPVQGGDEVEVNELAAAPFEQLKDTGCAPLRADLAVEPAVSCRPLRPAWSSGWQASAALCRRRCPSANGRPGPARAQAREAGARGESA
eukprot:CAMPEP_0197930032 /NCGR_PEP_ID=MMETSP1439-20131203/104829_1 /TAXON_ID=66791 /ORGANISM="Gonyaulax spinifera, Strain CCMP409" /LENGTH=111 /DNA_ID=CAMNT_0043552707 /DNA_START=232 /DNA_END=564 /DNA_ORIENTATION=-